MSVILGYDGRPGTRGALDFAVKYARMAKAPLYVYSSVVSEEMIEHEGEMAKLREHAREAESVAREAGVETVHVVIEPGHAAENILAAATRFKCDVIVVGKSNKTIIDRAILGSVSQHVVNHAKCPVVVVH